MILIVLNSINTQTPSDFISSTEINEDAVPFRAYVDACMFMVFPLFFLSPKICLQNVSHFIGIITEWMVVLYTYSGGHRVLCIYHVTERKRATYAYITIAKRAINQILVELSSRLSMLWITFAPHLVLNRIPECFVWIQRC